jgi:hypothetical protein
MSRINTGRTMVALMAVAAIFAPVATAKPIDSPLPGVSSVNAQQQPNPSDNLPTGVLRATGGAFDNGAAVQTAGGSQASAAETPASGFQWGDAAIGAAAMLALLCLGTGVVLIGQRSRIRRQPAPVS